MVGRSKNVVNSVNQILNGVKDHREADFATLVGQYESTANWLDESIENYKRKLLSIAANRSDLKKKTKLDKENITVDCNAANNNQIEPPVKELQFEKNVSINGNSDEKSDPSSHPRYLSIMAMKVVELRKELKKLQLDTKGLKKDMQKRLLDAVIERDNKLVSVSPKLESSTKSKRFFAKSSDDESIQEDDEEKSEPMPIVVTETSKVESMTMDVDSKDVTANEILTTTISDKQKPDETIKKASSNESELEKPVIESKQGTVKATAALFSGKKDQIVQHPIAGPSTLNPAGKRSAQSSSQNTTEKSMKKRSDETLVTKDSDISEISKTSSLSSGSGKPSKHSSTSAKTLASVKETESVKLTSSILKKTTKLNRAEQSNTTISSSVKEKQKQLAEARKQRLAELRSKSKPLKSAQKVATNASFQTLSSSKFASGGIKSSDKRTLMTAKIREKHAALKSQGIGKVAVPVLKGTLQAPKSSKKVFIQQNIEYKQLNSSPSIKSILSPLSTYEISDRGEDSSSSDESECSEKAPKKKVPNWAQKSNLLEALHKQYDNTKDRFDPDSIFPEVETCDLEAIFNKKKNRYKKRASTGNWLDDRVTAAEKLTYKRDMGFSTKCS